MKRILIFPGIAALLFAACSKDTVSPSDRTADGSCVINSSEAYWQEIEGLYDNDVYFLIDHDLLWCDNAKLDLLIDSIQKADNIVIDRGSVNATFTDLKTGEMLLHVDSVYSKQTNANKLIHDQHPQYSEGLLTDQNKSIAEMKLVFTDKNGHAIVSANHPDNIVTMNFEHLEPGVDY